MITDQQSLVAIRLSDLWPSGRHPQRSVGAFEGDVLSFCAAPDLELSWLRQAGEDASTFEKWITADILAARGAPAQLRHGALEKPIPREQSPLYRSEAPRLNGSSKMADPSYREPPKRGPAPAKDQQRHWLPRKKAVAS